MEQMISALLYRRKAIDQIDPAQLKAVVLDAPYCQPARMLYAKALMMIKDPGFEQQVNRATAIAPDRRSFRAFLSGREQPDIPETKVRSEGHAAAIYAAGENNPDKDQHKTKIASQQAIIDEFLKKNPRIEAKRRDVPEGEMAPESLKNHPDLISETLAVVLAKQGQNKRAKEIYEKLSLKFPEKSSYFAKKLESI